MGNPITLDMSSFKPLDTSPTTPTAAPSTGGVKLDMSSFKPLDQSSTPGSHTPTIGPEPKTGLGSLYLKSLAAPLDPIGAAGEAWNGLRQELHDHSGEHPLLGEAADKMDALQELLFGGQSVGKPMGTRGGVAEEAAALSGVPEAADLTEAGVGAVADALERRAAARTAEERVIFSASDGSIHSVPAKSLPEAQKIDPKLRVLKPADEIHEGHLTAAKPTPAPQHGTPVTTASPLDNATINKMPGGKDLSPEAIETLKKHVGGTPGAEIEVGSTPKNTVMKAVAPMQKTLTDTGLKMNEAIQNAPAFNTSVITDSTNPLADDINAVRDSLPLKLKDSQNDVVDTQLKAAHPALTSTDPSEVLAYRRKLGNQIDWNNITNSPETAGETRNITQVKIYNALGNKLHSEIPETARLDKIFQPNLELQSHLDAKLGKAVSRDPVEASAQHWSELQKGKAQIAADIHNAQVAKNWSRIKTALTLLGAGAAGTAGAEIFKHITE